jgi:hypothetical protein
MKTLKALSRTAILGMAALVASHEAGAGPSRRAAPPLARSEGDEVRSLRIARSYGQMPLDFEVNQGQTDPQVRFLSRGRGYSLFLTPVEAVLVLQSAVVRMRLLGTNAAPVVRGVEERPGKSNYFLGNDPTKWRAGVSHFARVEYRDVYPGVTLIYFGNQQQLEYDFVVAPGVDPRAIRLGIEGARKIRLDHEGKMILKTAAGDLVQRAPVAYQEKEGVRRTIPARYALRDRGEVGFEVGAYDRTRPLIIDPVLIYSTYLGGSSEDFGLGIAVDAAGNAYVTGYTNSMDFPTAGTPSQSARAEPNDAFVTKLDPNSARVYSTYLGGSGDDIGAGIAVDAAGNAYVTGNTTSTDFPTAGTPSQSANAGHDDAFVTKLDATSGLVYSTYLGGSGYDYGLGIAVDAAGNAYVTGGTNYADFQMATTPSQTDHAAGMFT